MAAMGPALYPPCPTPHGRAAALADAVLGTLRVARALARTRRTVDLKGLDHEVGRLCAAVLDLPTAEGTAMRPLLIDVLAGLDALAAAVAVTREDEA
jgi:hypothetical protein